MVSNKFIALLLLLLATMAFAKESQILGQENQMEEFNIKLFRAEQKKQPQPTSSVSIVRADKVETILSENKDDYSRDVRSASFLYRIYETFHKESLLLLSHKESFYGIPVLSKDYDGMGYITKKEHFGAEGWPQKLTNQMKARFNVSLNSQHQAFIGFTNYQGKEVFNILHLSGEGMPLRADDIETQYAFFDYETLELLSYGRCQAKGDKYVYLSNGKIVHTEIIFSKLGK